MKNILIFITSLIVLFSAQSNAQVPVGNAKISDTINRTDSSGNKVGYWIEKQGDFTYKGEYISGQKEKNWIGYYPNNFVFKLEYYSNGLKDGISMQFDRRGKIVLIENYKKGLAHGQTINYGSYSETPMVETDYANGMRNGLYRIYYDNAKIQEETWYKDDLKNGLSRWNKKSGQKLAEYNYKSGYFDGIQKVYYENDSLQSVNNYSNNLLSGESKEYYRNGKVKISGKYILGQKDGAWTEYDELGKVQKVTKYKNGLDVKKK